MTSALDSLAGPDGPLKREASDTSERVIFMLSFSRFWKIEKAAA
jgi:hypothetical protein